MDYEPDTLFIKEQRKKWGSVMETPHVSVGWQLKILRICCNAHSRQLPTSIIPYYHLPPFLSLIHYLCRISQSLMRTLLVVNMMSFIII